MAARRCPRRCRFLRARCPADARPQRALKPAADMLGPLPYTGLQSMFDPLFPKRIYSYARSYYFDAIPPAMVDDMIAWAERKPTPMSLTHLNHFGGAMGRVANG